jgi:hypothetical protein
LTMRHGPPRLGLRLGETLATHAGLLASPQTLFSCLAGTDRMHIIYVDESGTPEPEPNSRHFVMAGVAIPLPTWKVKDAEVRALLQRSRLPGVELHSAWMARRYPEQERVADFDRLSDDDRRRIVKVERKKDLAKASLQGDIAVRSLRKNYAKTEAYVHLTHDERVRVLRSVADAVAAWGDARLFGEAQLKSALSRDGRERAREFALEQLTTRFNMYLGNVHGSDALGIIVHDQNQATSVKLTGVFRMWHQAGTRFMEIPHVAETPLFVDSSLTVMVQIADLISYATRRFFDNGDVDLFDRIYSRYDRNPAKLLVGLRHFTAKEPCVCRVCIDHGR